MGEPMIAGGEFGDEDERMITRLENQFEPNCPVKMEHQEPVNGMGFLAFANVVQVFLLQLDLQYFT